MSVVAKEVFADEYFRIVVDERSRLVWLIRTTAAFPTLEMLKATFDDVTSVVRELPREWSPSSTRAKARFETIPPSSRSWRRRARGS